MITKSKLELENRRSWEQTRLIMWAAGTWKDGTKAIDIMSFDWEQLTPQERYENAVALRAAWIWNTPNFDKIKKLD